LPFIKLLGRVDTETSPTTGRTWALERFPIAIAFLSRILAGTSGGSAAVDAPIFISSSRQQDRISAVFLFRDLQKYIFLV
jgi:hypothetical protein